MKRLLIAIFSLLSVLGFSQTQIRLDKKLQRKIDTLLIGFKGTAGIYIKNLKNGTSAGINYDTIFPTASMIKIPILLGIMEKIEKKELTYHQPLIYKDSLLYEGEDILGSFKNNETISLNKVIMLMLTTSDNTASLWLQSLGGGGQYINQLLQQNGFSTTRVNSRTPGREEARQQYGWGQTTPIEMVALLEKIYKGQIINKPASDKMIRLLGRNFWDEEALSQFPPNIFIASKNGAVNKSRSETLLVMAPNNPFIFSIITKNQEDESWGLNNEGWVLARKLATILWQHFEPNSQWQPLYTIEGKLK